MVDLPSSSELDIRPLTVVFKHTTNSYKFFWFLSILESVREGHNGRIPVRELLARMVSYAWYPINYFRLSLGRQDRLPKIVELLRSRDALPRSAPRRKITTQLLDHIAKRTSIGQEVSSLADYVPQRFLRPFMRGRLDGIPDWEVDRHIRTLASLPSNGAPPMYRFARGDGDEYIEILLPWYDYLQRHIAILEGFCLWHLARYLERNNPNVPNVAAKVFPPAGRDMSRARRFWDLAIQSLGNRVTCIYSGQPLFPSAYTIDHFIPWSFTGHDMLWNLIPVAKKANSSKGDSLPDMDAYFEPFCRLQFDALRKAAEQVRNTQLLEDYVLLLRESPLPELAQVSYVRFRQALHDTVAPQILIASNMGFPSGWRYDG